MSNDITPGDLAKCLSRTISSLDEKDAELPFLRIKVLRKEELTLRHKSIFARLVIRKTMKEKTARHLEWIFLCDGLDEMAPEIRPSLFHWIRGLPRSVRVVLATRPGILEETGRLPRSKEYEVCDFEKEQIHLFVTQWFDSNKPLGNAFINQIESNRSLFRLAAIPLLLTCLSMDVEVRQDAIFPENLLESDLLRRAVEIMLDKWDATKEGRAVDPSRIQLGMRVFIELAVGHEFGSKVQYSELVTEVHKCANELGIEKKAADQFLNRITTSGRLLIGTSEYGFAFGHAVFFDFFFAEGVKLLTEAFRHTGRVP